MKKSKVLVAMNLILSAFASQVASADSFPAQPAAHEYRASITANPAAFLLGYFDVGADVKIAPQVTIGAYVNFASYTVGVGSSSSSITAFGGGGRAHFYLSGGALQDGWFVSPFAGVLPVRSFSSTLTVLDVGGIIGYQWVYSSGFTQSLGLGAQYISVSENRTDSYLRGTIPALEYKIGIAF
jgi:hypothetical protein